MDRRAFDRSFTAGLFLAAAIAVGALLRLQRVEGPPAGIDDWKLLFAVPLVGWALLSAAVGCLRAAGLRAAWRATDLGLFPLLFWFPVGTGLFVWWRLGLRDAEEYRMDHPS